MTGDTNAEFRRGARCFFSKPDGTIVPCVVDQKVSGTPPVFIVKISDGGFDAAMSEELRPAEE